MRRLIIAKAEFFYYLNKLIESGVTFEAKDNDKNDTIEIIFTGGF